MTTAVASDHHNLQSKSLKELADLYNSLVPEKPVGKFKDKPTAIRRVEVVLEAKGTKAEVVAPTVSEKRQKAERKRGGGRKRSPFVVGPKVRIKPHRENTRRAEAVKMLTKGATLEELMAETRWNYRQAKEAVWLLHKHLGYGLQENPSSGKITLVLPPSKI